MGCDPSQRSLKAAKAHAVTSAMLLLGLAGALGACSGPADPTPSCTPGETRCGEEGVEVCTEEGVFLLEQACEGECQAGEDGASCVAPYTAGGYAGSESCAFCHGTNASLEGFSASSHALALTAVEDGEAPIADLPPPPGMGWEELSFVVGGQYHRAVFADGRGGLVTGSDDAPDVQYVLGDHTFVPYRTGEDLPLDCAACHATGYDPAGTPPHNLPEAVGTWSEAGVQCEACHGAAASHVLSADPSQVTTDPSPDGCLPCHTASGSDAILAADGFLLPNAQIEELAASPHGGQVSCVDCHDPHRSLDDAGAVATCADCHADVQVNLGMGELGCVDCHMPKVVAGARQVGPYEADLRSHLVGIDLDPAATLLSAEGDRATGRLSLDYVCLRCHEDETAAWASQTAAFIHARSETTPDFVGDDTCAACHAEHYATYQASGHPNVLHAVVDDAAPTWPYTAVSEPPPGLGWEDVALVVGGYRHAASFVDQGGHLVTGEEALWGMGSNQWLPYHPGETLGFECAPCHTTGYDASAAPWQGLEGVTGSWAQEGVRCEACHGAGRAHVLSADPEDILVDASPAACGSCHTNRDPEDRILADGAFIRHEGQYQEWLASPHAGGDDEVGCAGCHTPHESSSWPAGAAPGLIATCESCHAHEATHQKSESMTLYGATCLDCHMPRYTLAAEGDPATFTADVRTHLFAIDPETLHQFEDGESAQALSLDAACGSCHHRGGVGLVHPDEEMTDMAEGYHHAP